MHGRDYLVSLVEDLSRTSRSMASHEIRYDPPTEADYGLTSRWMKATES